MQRRFTIAAVEVDPDGNEDVLDHTQTRLMNLPFDEGWDHWRVYQGEYLVGSFPTFAEAQRVCSALNHLP